MSPPDRPTLFILKPDFPDPAFGPGRYFCPHSAAVEGLLAFYPRLREALDVRYVDFQRPRAAVIVELGEANQACPVLVLPKGFPLPSGGHRTAQDRVFFVGESEIAAWLTTWAGIGARH